MLGTQVEVSGGGGDLKLCAMIRAIVARLVLNYTPGPR